MAPTSIGATRKILGQLTTSVAGGFLGGLGLGSMIWLTSEGILAVDTVVAGGLIGIAFALEQIIITTHSGGISRL
jgi:hypothetical protein